MQLVTSMWMRPRATFIGTAPVLACRPSYLSPLGWLALQAAALWPHGAWMARRVQDGSDEPLGLAALALLLMLLVARSHTLRIAPHTGWLAASALLTLTANAALLAAPPLLCALVGALALAAALMAWLPARGPRAPLAGLVVLALPLISSLQYYGGYPLRVLTAQLSAWALQFAGIAAERCRHLDAGARAAGHRRRALLGRADGVDGVLLRLRGGRADGAARRGFPQAPAGGRRAGAGRQRAAQQPCWWRWSRGRRGWMPTFTRPSPRIHSSACLTQAARWILGTRPRMTPEILPTHSSLRRLLVLLRRNMTAAARHLDDLKRRLGRSRHLLRNRLPLDAFAVAQRQDNRADHGDEQHHSGRLEEVEYFV